MSSIENAGPDRLEAIEGRTILFIVWPEPGHVVAPLVLARRLRARGHRPVFAGASKIEEAIRAAGFEFRDLSRLAESDAGPRCSVFSVLPGRWALGRAVDHLVGAFASIIKCYRPELILFDSLYSALTILAEASNVRWAQYETDLPRELDPEVPPPGSRLVPSKQPCRDPRIRAAWASALWEARRARRGSKRFPVGFSWTMASYFPDALVAELERRFGRRVEFNRHTVYPPVARGPRMIFCPRGFDFPRQRADRSSWVGPCLGPERSDPDFPWRLLPSDMPIAYCAFGTQSLRNERATVLLRMVVEVISRRSDLFLIVACPPAQSAAWAANRDCVLTVPFAPQRSLLRRASVFITHAGFNSVKEGASMGVPMIALPLSHDQPRNGALIEYHGIGMSLDPERLTPEQLDRAVTDARNSAVIRDNCNRTKNLFADAAAHELDLALIDDLLHSRPAGDGTPGDRRATIVADDCMAIHCGPKGRWM